MTEEDTFKRLKGKSWEDAYEALNVAYNSQGENKKYIGLIESGWSPKKWLEEYYDRHEHLGLTETKTSYVDWWLTYWGLQE